MVNITINTGGGISCHSAKRGRSPRVGLRGGGGKGHSTVDRFWARVQKSDDGCWRFAGAVCNRAGHIHICREDGSRAFAHRLSYELHHGPIPAGQVVRHRCDVPACVNPAHLLVGSQGDNIQDAIDRDRRNAWGIQRLTCADVLDIRARFALGESQKSLAAFYRVSKGCIHSVVHRLTWRRVEDALQSSPSHPEQPQGHGNVPHLLVHARTVANSAGSVKSLSVVSNSVASDSARRTR